MSELAAIIRGEIQANGPISFARFMELALYHPGLGYYQRPISQTGRAGDFYTSVSVGPMFGELLAFQFSEWLEGLVEAGVGERVQLVEAGAHDGQLALDILSWISMRRPKLAAKLEYVILEPSARRAHGQSGKLTAFRKQIRWHSAWSSVGPQAIDGVIFSNELLDAFPVHRIRWDACKNIWVEWGVGLVGGRFDWTPLANHSASDNPALRRFEWPELPEELLAVLPNGFTTEISPDATRWWGDAAHALRVGKLLTTDYGRTKDEFFVPERAGGTLRAYRRHQSSADLLGHVGEQDLTADVNFSALQLAGESLGMSTEGLESQPKFLTRIAETTWKAPASFGEWPPERVRQFQTLMHPEHLGRAFQVLVQSR